MRLAPGAYNMVGAGLGGGGGAAPPPSFYNSVPPPRPGPVQSHMLLPPSWFKVDLTKSI